jgi:hypothetical protein
MGYEMDCIDIINEFQKLIESREDIEMTDCAIIIAVSDQNSEKAAVIVGGGPSLSSTVFDALVVRIGGQICRLRGINYSHYEELAGESTSGT